MKIINRFKLPEKLQIEDLDHASVSLLHAEIIQSKRFLRKLYIDFYHILKAAIRVENSSTATIVELGSGGGFVKDVIPCAITSDVLRLLSVDMVFSAMQMPFEEQSVDAFVMIDVLHHIPDVSAFFVEVIRCLAPGGRVIMIEPANTVWGRFIYKNFHHEPFDPKADWKFESKGPLSSANGALPWIIFHRDRDFFEKEFPQLKIIKLEFHTPFRYLCSGGFTLRQLTPSWTYGMVKGIETILSPLNRWIGMFETIVLEKTSN